MFTSDVQISPSLACAETILYICTVRAQISVSILFNPTSSGKTSQLKNFKTKLGGEIACLT